MMGVGPENSVSIALSRAAFRIRMLSAIRVEWTMRGVIALLLITLLIINIILKVKVFTPCSRVTLEFANKIAVLP